MHIRTFAELDRAAVINLWHRVGLTRPWNDPDRDIDRKLADSPWGLLVGEDGDRVIAAVMVGYDGHRGTVNYLAVDPAWRGRGAGSALMDHAEALLLDRGCPEGQPPGARGQRRGRHVLRAAWVSPVSPPATQSPSPCASSRTDPSPEFRAIQMPATLRKLRRRRLLVTTKTEENAIAAPAMKGFSRPSIAIGMAATL